MLPWIAIQMHTVFGPSAYILNKELNLVFQTITCPLEDNIKLKFKNDFIVEALVLFVSPI